MEYRKLISFGKNSFVVSLPKAWVVQNKMKKGDLVYLEESASNLVLSKKEGEQNNAEKERVIFVDGKSIPLLMREVNAAYITNCRLITLKGKEVKSKVKELQEVIQNLIALEVMEQTPDAISAKDFLNMDKVSIEELIRKMDVVTRTMLKETSHVFIEDNYVNINERDKDVNRLYFLLYRTVLYNLENPTKAIKNFKFSAVDLLKLHSIGFYLEGIADEARRAARFMHKLKISAPERKVIEQFLAKIDQFYQDTMKATYTKDIELALRLSELKKKLNTELDTIEERNIVAPYFSTLMGRLRRMISHLHHLGRLVYTI